MESRAQELIEAGGVAEEVGEAGDEGGKVSPAVDLAEGVGV